MRKPAKITRVATVSDFQVPFVRYDAVAWAIERIREWRPHLLVVNGDLLDLHGIGPGEGREAPDVDIVDEYVEGARLLAELRKAAPRGVACVFLNGNHEFRALARAGRAPGYFRRALSWNHQRGCEEFERWAQVPYRKHPSGIYAKGKILWYHGARTGANANCLEACTIAKMKQRAFTNQLVLFGHTHQLRQPTRCKRTASIELPLWYANTGTFCDPDQMEWTHKVETDAWHAGIFVGTTTSTKWSGEVLDFDA